MGSLFSDNMIIDKYEDRMIKMHMMRIRSNILTSKFFKDEYKTEFKYEVFSSWWQHFKNDKMPKWFIKIYPVKKTSKNIPRTIKFTRYAEYPMANLALQKDSKFYEVQLGGFERIVDKVEEY